MSRRAKVIYDEARITALRFDAVLSVLGHAVEGVIDLQRYPSRLAADDSALQMAAGDIVGLADAQALFKANAFDFERWARSLRFGALDHVLTSWSEQRLSEQG